MASTTARNVYDEDGDGLAKAARTTRRLREERGVWMGLSSTRSTDSGGEVGYVSSGERVAGPREQQQQRFLRETTMTKVRGGLGDRTRTRVPIDYGDGNEDGNEDEDEDVNEGGEGERVAVVAQTWWTWLTYRSNS